MRDLMEIDDYRVRDSGVLSRYGWAGDGTCGAFEIPYPRTGVRLRVVASSGEGWDHVSVSLPNRCPNWHEMSFIKRMLFGPETTVMQLHVAEDDHINRHPNCLHLWRPHDAEIPLPPKEFV